MENILTVLAGLLIIMLLSYGSRRLKRHLRGAGRDRASAERQALTEAEVFTRSRLPF